MQTEIGKGKATASLVLGIISIVCVSWIAGIIGLVLAKKSIAETSMAGVPVQGIVNAGKICSIIGIILGAISTVVAIIAIATGAAIGLSGLG